MDHRYSCSSIISFLEQTSFNHPLKKALLLLNTPDSFTQRSSSGDFVAYFDVISWLANFIISSSVAISFFILLRLVRLGRVGLEELPEAESAEELILWIRCNVAVLATDIEHLHFIEGLAVFFLENSVFFLTRRWDCSCYTLRVLNLWWLNGGKSIEAYGSC